VVVTGVLIGVILWLTSTEAERTESTDSATLVNAIEVEYELASPRVEAQGTVVPARQVTVEPEVSGRISERHPGFVTGGVVQEGDLLFEIDARDYERAVEQAQTDVELARADFEIEEGRQVVAQEEWQRFGEPDEDAPPLALREPHKLQAELEIERAEQELEQARLELERTGLHAPFTALVKDADIEPGELVSPQSSTATLVALDEFWVQVSVPIDSLGQIAIPGRDGDRGSAALIRQESADEPIVHQGKIIRLLGDLAPAGRMAQLLVSVDDPFSLSGQELERPEPGTPVLREAPLLLNSFVAVELQGADESPVIQLPRRAVRNGDQTFVATSDDTLEIRDLDIAWSDSRSIAVEGGLDDGARVIVSDVPAPVEGMSLRTEVQSRQDLDMDPPEPFDSVAREQRSQQVVRESLQELDQFVEGPQIEAIDDAADVYDSGDAGDPSDATEDHDRSDGDEQESL